MVVRAIVAVTVAAVLVIAIARGLKAADWMLMRQAPGEQWQQRGPMFDQQTACMTALASDGIAVPAGTRLKCQRVIATKEATR